MEALLLYTLKISILSNTSYMYAFFSFSEEVFNRSRDYGTIIAIHNWYPPLGEVHVDY